MQELPQYQVSRKYGQHANNFENYLKEILETFCDEETRVAIDNDDGDGILEHELGFCNLHDRTWGPDKNLPQSGTNDLIE